MFGGDGDMTGFLIGFLLAQATSVSRSSTGSRYLGTLTDRQPGPASKSSNDLKPMAVPKETVDQSKKLKLNFVQKICKFFSVRELRKQNGFGFLWGPKIAKKLKAVADQNDQKREHGQQQPAFGERQSAKQGG